LDDYLESITTILESERAITRQTHVSTVFIASKENSKRFHKRLVQWLIDPSYRYDDQLVQRLFEVLERYGCEIGIHGSFYSIAEDHLKRERHNLSKAAGRQINCGRQHWLNLPGVEPFHRIYRSGVRIDSTLGWNGGVGFRGGMARPFPLVLGPNEILWEVPLLLMDRPLFEDLKLDRHQVVERAISLLEEVYSRRGCVSLCWHGEAAHPDYKWFDAYEDILKWAKGRGFQFCTISQAIGDKEISAQAS